MTVLSSSYGIIMDRSINSPGHEKNAVDILNATEKHYLKEKMELIGKLASNETLRIKMPPALKIRLHYIFRSMYAHS